MKRISLLFLSVLFITAVQAQEFTKELREVGEFTAIDAGGAFDI